MCVFNEGVVWAKAPTHAVTDIRFQFGDCEAQAEDSRGQDRPGQMTQLRKYIG